MIIIVIIRNNVPLFQAFLLNKLKPTCVLCGVSLVVVFSVIGNFIRSIENILIVLAALTLSSSIPDWTFLKCSLILFAKSDWSDCCETWRGEFPVSLMFWPHTIWAANINQKLLQQYFSDFSAYRSQPSDYPQLKTCSATFVERTCEITASQKLEVPNKRRSNPNKINMA
uniref:Uncharacterized protein n=1 Tax=Glossina pallidipes TaxID=7398 RepID=A0A1A9ZDU9_GLOPL